jgi:hypothetical protein
MLRRCLNLICSPSVFISQTLVLGSLRKAIRDKLVVALKIHSYYETEASCGRVLDDFAAASGLLLLIPGLDILLRTSAAYVAWLPAARYSKHNEIIGSCQKWNETPPALEPKIAIAVQTVCAV